MEQQTEKNDIAVPLIVFNVALVGLIVSLGFLIYGVDTTKKHITQQQIVSSSVVFQTPPIQAQSFVIFDLKTGKVIAEKDSTVARPLASITKVMSALVARKMLPKDSQVVMRKEFLVEEGDSGLRDGEVFKLSDLLDFSLIVSSNDGARSIASVAGAFKLKTKDYTLGRTEFIKQMNAEAQELGLTTLFFTNETGLDNPTGTTGGYGSPQEVAKLFGYILKEYPDLLEATHIEREVVRSDRYSHEIVNTNDSLSDIPNVIASKTGFTNMAGGNLAVVFDAGFGKPVAIVVLGSTTEGRFKDVVALASSTLRYLAQ
jgi:D-alanyl-D-alanine carboxypeptidase